MTSSPCNHPLQTQKSRPPHQTVRRTAAVVSSFRPLPPSTPNRCVPTTPAHLFFLRKKIPASQKARVGTSTVSLARGANREVKERVKGKASRVQSTRIGSALVCVRRNVQHLELKLSKSTRFVLVTVVMVAVPTGCVCVCVFFPFILDIKFVGRTSRGHTGGRSHRISHPPSFCGACLIFSREKDSASIPFPRRP